MRFSQALFLAFKNSLIVLLALSVLSACSLIDDESDDDNGGTGQSIVIGKSDTGGFQENAISILDNELTSYESTEISVSLVDENGQPFTTPIQVSFSASCPTSLISPETVNTAGGTATATYTAGHCEGADTITATANINGVNLLATGSIQITRGINLALYVSLTDLLVGQSTYVQAEIYYNNYDRYPSPVDVTFASNCVSGTFLPQVANTSSGYAQSQFTPDTCTGAVEISATATINGVQVSGTNYITVHPFVSISVSVDNIDLLPGEAANVVATLSNSDSSPYTTPTPVYFYTSCATSSIAPSPNVSSGNTASATYIAGNCVGIDTITAEASSYYSQIQGAANVNISLPVVNAALGRGAGPNFVQGELQTSTGNTGVGQSPLSPGGSTSITATLVDVDNSNLLFSSFSGDVSFSSPCSAAGLATITTPISFNAGIATTTYVNNGCAGDDIVTATASVNGVVLVATSTITSSPQTLGTIQFVSSQPEQIAISGIGASLPNTSTLTFRVQDNMANPVRGQLVEFALDTNFGGTQLSAPSGLTDFDGNVTVLLQAGTRTTPVRVIASTTDINTGTEYSTVSDAIVISSLYPEQNNFSLQFSTCNPSAWDTNGVTVQIMALAADHYNNPVPDGTPVSFATEGGSIEGSCLTVNGQCSVNWTSQDPRPSDGRVTVLATMVGNESFIDLNSNGVLDDGDVWGPSLPEAWIDDNENGVFDTGVEQFLDFDLDGFYTPANSLYDGVLCQHSTDCSGNNAIHVRQSGVINMASVNNVVTVDGGGGMNAEFIVPISTQAPQPVIVNVQSITGQFPAAGTTIAVETTNGVISGPSNFEVPNSCNSYPGDSYPVTVYMNGDGTANTGIFTVTVTTDGYVSQQTVNITDLAE